MGEPGLGPRVNLNIHVAVAISVVSILHQGLLAPELANLPSAPLARIFKDALIETLHCGGLISDQDVARLLREEAAAREAAKVCCDGGY